MRSLTKRQQQVYLKLKREWAVLGRQPPLSNLAASLGMHYVSLKQHLKALEAKGYLTMSNEGNGRSPVITLIEEGLPLLGEIAAGGLSTTEQEIAAYLDLPAKGRFALRVRGDSMSEFVHHGDVVILKAGDFRDGEICAVYTEEGTTLKYVYREGKRTRLVPHNKDYPTLTVATETLRVQGVFHALIRGPLVDELMKEASL